MLKKHDASEEDGLILEKLELAARTLAKHGGDAEVIRFLRNSSIGMPHPYLAVISKYKGLKRYHQDFSSAEDWNKRVWAQAAVYILTSNNILKKPQAAKFVSEISGLKPDPLRKIDANEKGRKPFFERSLGKEVAACINFFADRRASIVHFLDVCLRGCAKSPKMQERAENWLNEEVLNERLETAKTNRFYKRLAVIPPPRGCKDKD